MNFNYKLCDINEYIDELLIKDEDCVYLTPSVVNDERGGKMGSGLAKTLYERYPQVKNDYHKWAKSNPKNNPFKLGRNQTVWCEGSLYVVNMVAQSDCGGYQPRSGPHLPPIRYQSLTECLYRLKDDIILLTKERNNIEIFTGLIGCDRAGGDMLTIKKMVWNVFYDVEIDWTWISYDENQLKRFAGLSIFS